MNTKLLKQKILDLSIRGKLVPQDPNDEPASELLKRIRAEKEKLIAEGKIKRSKKAGDKPHYGNENAPFEIPKSWEWVKLKDIAIVFNGKSQSDVVDPNGIYPIYGSGGIMGYANDYLCPEHCTIIGRKGTINNPILVETKFWNVDTAFGMSPNKSIDYHYFHFFCESFDFTSLDKSTTLPSLTKTNIELIDIPLPPRQEQSRIVSEIQKLLAFINQIEDDKYDLQVVIKQTKNRILDLAIHGKLVHQDPDDEPAIELLKRINPAIKPCDTSHYGNLPKSWCICKLKDVFDITMGSSPTGDSLNNKHEGIEFHQGKLCFSELYLNKSEIYTDSPTKLAEKHSILLCVRAPVGVINITEREICIGRGLCSLKPKNGIDFMFAFYALQTHKSYFEANATGTTFKAIGGDTIRNEMFTLPPYDEQVRIRKKIESLFYELDLISSEL
jgi:type I restriction enzyme S subunit